MISIFLFYNQAVGKQLNYTFSKDFKHANIITYDGDIYLWSELQSRGIVTHRIKAKSVTALVNRLRIMPALISTVTVWVEDRPMMKWFPFMIWSCNEHCRYISGCKVGLTLNPLNLYKKLLKYDKSRNYKILHQWRR